MERPKFGAYVLASFQGGSMARAINRLTEKGAKAVSEAGFYADGAGLYLRVDETLRKRWVFVYFWRKKRREMGLGAFPTIGVAAARKLAADARASIAAGHDPIEARRTAALPSYTFGQFAAVVISDLSSGWRSPKAAPQWTASLQQHARAIWDRPLDQVDTADVLEVLTPIWQEIPETARRVRNRIERVLDIAKVRGLRTGENPARLRGHLKLILPAQIADRGHHAAMAYEDLPDFLRELRAREATAARALEFLILTATRTTETREAVWSEISGDVWTIPKGRMKAKREHRVPLCARAVEILDEMRPYATRTPYVFPGDQIVEPLSNMAMGMLLRRMGRETVTVHGFRSTFRDWAGDCTTFAREIIEEALAHKMGTAVEHAYRRRDAIERRRVLMNDWATFCLRAPNVISLPVREA